jgi:hypothetical protein
MILGRARQTRIPIKNASETFARALALKTFSPLFGPFFAAGCSFDAWQRHVALLHQSRYGPIRDCSRGDIRMEV